MGANKDKVWQQQFDIFPACFAAFNLTIAWFTISPISPVFVKR